MSDTEMTEPLFGPAILLTFRTPSKTCPLRKMNGARVSVVNVSKGWRKVRRTGGFAREWLVQFPDGNRYWTFPDELFIEPEVTLAESS